MSDLDKFKRVALSWPLLLGIFFSTFGHANVGEFVGFGSRVAGLAGAGVAGNAGAFSAYHNPAELGVETDQRLLFSWGFVFVQPTFRPITNVVTQNLFNSDGVNQGNVDTSYRSTLGQEIGISYRLIPDFYNFTFGLVTFLPLDAVAFMDTGEAYIPEYFMYRARTQRPQVEAAMGMDLGKGFHLGGGLHFGFSLTGNASAFINTQSGTASSMRFATSLKPKAAPYFGLLYASPEHSDSFGMGLVFRLPVASDNTMVLNSAARVFGDFAAVDFNFTALSTLFYDPMALELGGAWKHSSWGKAYAQVDYQVWSAFTPPAMLIQQPQTTNCKDNSATHPCNTVKISAGRIPQYRYYDVVVPRFGEEIALSDGAIFRMGYAYRSSIFGGEVSNGEGNYLDPAKHMFNLGLGLKFNHFLAFAIQNYLDFHFSYQYLVLQHIVKTPGNETGNMSDSKIGSPGYDAGGSLLGGGVSLSLAF